MIETRPLQVNASDKLSAAKIVRRKKFKKWGIVAAIVVIIVVLAIVLPLTLIKSDNSSPPLPPPTPIPPDPYSYQEFNFFTFVNDSTYKETAYSIQFTLEQ